jgi:hypothetical protein
MMQKVLGEATFEDFGYDDSPYIVVTIPTD